MPVAVTNVIKRRKRNSRMAGKIKRGAGGGGEGGNGLGVESEGTLVSFTPKDETMPNGKKTRKLS